MLRLMLVGLKSSDVPLGDVKGAWTTCTPETAKGFSAIAYFFGREIAAKEHVAVGLIDATWGGTPVSAWVSMDTLGNDAALLPAFSARATFADEQTELMATIAAEKAEDAAALAAGKPKPVHPWHPQEDSWLPGGLYNGMIAPLTAETVKGFIWYQGETDSAHNRAPYYSLLFPAMIEDWRMHFEQGDLPFLFVQISSFDSPQEEWGVVRDAQRRSLEVANTAMAVTLDVGNAKNVHPAEKQVVASRLALAALGMAYGQHVAYGSPLFREATTEPGAVRVWFDHAEGLNAGGKVLDGFEVAGADHRFVAAEAKIEGETIVVSAAGVKEPMYVRYGWSNVVTSWFYNSAGLPGGTFTSEEVPTTLESVR
jgi:sialate O-acetylesterase